jgi:hypothetical protein
MANKPTHSQIKALEAEIIANENYHLSRLKSL